MRYTEELRVICQKNSGEALEVFIHQQREIDPGYLPPLPELLDAATVYRADKIAAYCLENGQTDMVYGNKIDWVKFCLEHGANPNHNLIRGRHALAGAASKGNIEMVDLLLQHGARLESIYALVEAAIEGHLEMVKYLLLNGADIDEVRIKGPAGDECYEEMGNSLHHAAILGYTEMALFLIDAGANIHLKDLMGRTAEDLALEKNHTEILNALHQKMGTLDDRL